MCVFPLVAITCVTGVSGSGKSSLVAQTLAPALAQSLNRAQVRPALTTALKVLEHLTR
jgi:excinuclease ABC subunit A